MENASKALLIAGAILIVIILIGIGVAVINSTGNVQDQAASSANSLEVQAFNAQFTPYMGNSVSYNQVKKLLSVIRASNSANGYVFNNGADAADNFGKDKYVHFDPDGMSEAEVTEYGASYKYKVEISAYTSGGYVETIHIEPIQ